MKDKSNREEKLKYWRAHVEAHKKSGLSQKEYCRQKGISFWSFNPWKRRIESGGNKLQEIPSSIVHSLSLRDKEIELILGGRIRISIPEIFSEETLKNILKIFGVNI